MDEHYEGETKFKTFIREHGVMCWIIGGAIVLLVLLCLIIPLAAVVIFALFNTTDLPQNVVIQSSSVNTITQPTAPSEDTSGDLTDSEQFDLWINEWVKDYVSENLVNLHYNLSDPEAFGITGYDCTLGAASADAMLLSLQEEKTLYNNLQTLDYSQLSTDQQMTYDILTYYLELDADYEQYIYYSEPLSCLSGIHVQLPTLLAEYTFDDKQDVDDYMMLLTDVPRYFTDVMTFEEEKSAEGLFMSDTAACHVIEACEAVTSVAVAESYMCVSFVNRMEDADFLTEEEKDAYIQQNEEYIETYVYGAYGDMITGMEALLGTGTNEYGLCGLALGKEYYEYRIASKVGTSRSIEEIKQLTLKQVQSDIDNMSAYYADEVVEELASYQFTLTDPHEILEDLQIKMSNQFPVLPEVNYTVQDVPAEMEDIASPAYYLLPTIDSGLDTANRIFINRSAGYDLSTSLYTTLAHEGYPGHLYQTNYFKYVCGDPVRQMIACNGYVEGYATYVELLSYQWGEGISPELGALLAYNQSATLGFYALMDIGINYESWDRAYTREFIIQLFGVTEEEADSITDEIYDLIVEEPGNYLEYYVGYLEIVELRKQFVDDETSDEDLLNFHTELLNMGPMPFDVIREYMSE